MAPIIASSKNGTDLFFNDTAPTEIYTLPLHDALPIWVVGIGRERDRRAARPATNHVRGQPRSLCGILSNGGDVSPETADVLRQLAEHQVRAVATEIDLSAALYIGGKDPGGIGAAVQQRTVRVLTVFVEVTEQKFAGAHRVGGCVRTAGEAFDGGLRDAIGKAEMLFAIEVRTCIELVDLGNPAVRAAEARVALLQPFGVACEQQQEEVRNGRRGSAPAPGLGGAGANIAEHAAAMRRGHAGGELV